MTRRHLHHQTFEPPLLGRLGSLHRARSASGGREYYLILFDGASAHAQPLSLFSLPGPSHYCDSGLHRPPHPSSLRPLLRRTTCPWTIGLLV